MTTDSQCVLNNAGKFLNMFPSDFMQVMRTLHLEVLAQATVLTASSPTVTLLTMSAEALEPAPPPQFPAPLSLIHLPPPTMPIFQPFPNTHFLITKSMASACWVVFPFLLYVMTC